MAIISLDTKLVNILLKQHKKRPADVARYLGITRQGYHDMIRRKSISRVDDLAKLFGVDDKTDLINIR